MSAPPAYPRIPHVAPGRGTRDDRVLGPDDARRLLTQPVLVEEKLDGASVMLWRDGPRIECALRSGPGGRDRAKQLGPLRAWIGERADRLAGLLEGRAVYGEWLLLSHAVRYDALPSYLVGLDLWTPGTGFVQPDARNHLLGSAGLPSPPELYRGRLRNEEELEALLGTSRAGTEPMEGVVVRSLDGSEPRIAKLLRADFTPTPDAEWQHGRARNQLRERELSWH